MSTTTANQHWPTYDLQDHTAPTGNGSRDRNHRKAGPSNRRHSDPTTHSTLGFQGSSPDRPELPALVGPSTATKVPLNSAAVRGPLLEAESEPIDRPEAPELVEAKAWIGPLTSPRPEEAAGLEPDDSAGRRAHMTVIPRRRH